MELVQQADTWVLFEHLTPLENQSLDELYTLRNLGKERSLSIENGFSGPAEGHDVQDHCFKIISAAVNVKQRRKENPRQ